MALGRKPAPTLMKILKGEPNKDRINLNEPKISASIPQMPTHLNTYGKKEWQRIAPILAGMGILSEIDMAALAGYCQAYGRWVEAELNLDKLRGEGKDGMIVKSPKDYLMINPYLSIANKALDYMHKFLIEFGMTPSSRSRIVIDKTNEYGEDEALESFKNILRNN